MFVVGVGAVENTIENTISDAGNAISTTMNNEDNTMDNTMNNNMTNNNNGTNYTATRTSADIANAGTDMSTLWIWITVAIAGAVIVGLVWYYGAQNNIHD